MAETVSTSQCMDCHQVYDDLMPISLNIPREQWLVINPEDGGVISLNGYGAAPRPMIAIARPQSFRSALG